MAITRTPHLAPQLMSLTEAFNSAFALYQQNQLAHSEAVLRQLLLASPKHSHALHLLGVVTHQSGNTALAVQFIEQAVAVEPGNGHFLSNLGEMYRRLGQLDKAIDCGERALASSPPLATVYSNLGVAYYEQGDLDKAESLQRQALALDPSLPIALNNMGSILRGRKDLPGAIQYFRDAIKVDSTNLEAANNLGSVLTEDEKPEQALAVLLPVVKAQPDYAEAHCNIASAFLNLERLDKATFGFKRCLELKPDEDKAYVGLGMVFLEQKDLENALAMAERALALAPHKPETHTLLGSVLTELAYPDKAQAAFEKALEIDPGHLTAYLGRGHLFMENGDMAKAEADFAFALSLGQDEIGPRLALVQVDKVKPGDANMQALAAMTETLATMPETKAIPLHFALGKCYDDTKQYDAAFEHYLKGCALKRKRIDYSADNTDLAGQNIRAFFSKENIDRLRGEGCSSELPIFVLGMPRSGTTLTETIIASHPMVHGAGELNDILMIASQPQGKPVDGYPFSLNGITQAELKMMGKRYVQGLQTRAPDSPRITDKMPANFNCLGLIHLMLPNAKIVHVKRNPVDTCLSCFTRLFNKSQHQSYDLRELGRFYRNYIAMMAHWREVLPTGAFYEIQYEDIVANQKDEARKLIEYCGLDWDDACIDFHKTERHIRTASITQVRQPIYTTSVEKWRHYERHLGPLLEKLGDLVKA